MNTNFTGKSKLEILRSFGYEVAQHEGQFKACIKEDPEAFTLLVDTEEEAINEAYDFLLDEVDPDLGYVFPD